MEDSTFVNIEIKKICRAPFVKGYYIFEGGGFAFWFCYNLRAFCVTSKLRRFNRGWPVINKKKQGTKMLARGTPDVTGKGFEHYIMYRHVWIIDMKTTDCRKFLATAFKFSRMSEIPNQML